MLAALAVVVVASPAVADYVSIQQNLIDLIPDTTYVGGELVIAQDTEDYLTLNDPTALPGDTSNVSMSVNTFFSHVYLDAGVPKAFFTGGDVSLTFDYDDGVNPVSSHELSGPITQMVFNVTSTTTIAGAGLFDALTANLPGSGIWPALDLSTLKSLTVVFGGDLSEFNWYEDDLPDGRIESLVTFLPDESGVPGPATLLLLLPGVALLRRR